ncbi:Transcription factor VBP [Amphibalanus amphitrite]|uniref:Transcription factor VBP n=1 Tax=Amphibalanus amphitrite TaxID=1232801 RepID=A0A6A4WE86_AMPAM|nr:Transcription factor VBP [Amphibalanus amphitrite]
MSPPPSPAAAGGEQKPRRERSARTPRVPVKFRVSPADLALASAPGVQFDPQTRQFSDDELKPQPMCKKSKKQVVPDEAKDQKYWTRRERNNYAAKRSREARRLKENQIVLRANFLEKENVALRESIEEITRENERLKERLSSCTCR